MNAIHGEVKLPEMSFLAETCRITRKFDLRNEGLRVILHSIYYDRILAHM